jgi:hypothetical protein
MIDLYKDIGVWLKHLRLHKYTSYFSQMSYEQIMELNDEKLITANITLGARKKLLNNIEKLRSRPARLRQLCQVRITFSIS